MDFMRDLWGFLKTRKKLWLLPFLTVIGLLAALVFMTTSSSVAPFIYTLF